MPEVRKGRVGAHPASLVSIWPLGPFSQPSKTHALPKRRSSRFFAFEQAPQPALCLVSSEQRRGKKNHFIKFQMFIKQPVQRRPVCRVPARQTIRGSMCPRDLPECWPHDISFRNVSRNRSASSIKPASDRMDVLALVGQNGPNKLYYDEKGKILVPRKRSDIPSL